MRNLYNVVLKENLIGSPFAPHKKCGLFSWIPVVGDVIDGVVDLVTGHTQTQETNATNMNIAQQNLAATKDANEKNIAMQRETNAMQYKMFQEQNAFNEDMWNKQNAYNDPKAQVQRLLAAGINPAGGATSEAGSISSATPPSLTAPQMMPETLNYQHLNEGGYMDLIPFASAFFQNQLVNKQAQSVGLDNQAKMIDNAFKTSEKVSNLLEQKARISDLLASKNLKDEERTKLIADIETIDWTLQLFKDTYADLKRSARLQNDVMESQKQNLDAQTINQKIDASWKPLLNMAGIRLSNAQSNLLLEQVRLVTPQIEDLLSSSRLKNGQAIGQVILNQLNGLDLKTKKELKGLYDSNGVSKKISQLFYMLGDLLFSQVKFGFSGKY